MSATTTSRARRIGRRMAATWSDLDYAQRRLLEIQTGIAGPPRRLIPEPRARRGLELDQSD